MNKLHLLSVFFHYFTILFTILIKEFINIKEINSFKKKDLINIF